MKFLVHIFKFAALLSLMFVLTYLPFGTWLNTAIVIYAFWHLVD